MKLAGVHMVAANWAVDRRRTWKGYGYSRIIRRDGNVLARARTSAGDEIVYARLPLKKTPSAPDGPAAGK